MFALFHYNEAVVSIAFWFENKRTFATGIGASGEKQECLISLLHDIYRIFLSV